MAFDLASNPMTALNSALIDVLRDAGVDEGRIDQNPADAVLIFKPAGRITSGAAILAVHALLAEKGVAVVSTDSDRMGMIRIVFGRADDGTITPPIVKDTHDAILDDWFLCCATSTSLIVGTVRDDAKGRWPDGTTIHTSPLQTDTVVGEGVVVHTLRTAYLLGRQKQDGDLTAEDKLGSVLIGHPALALQVRN